MFKFGQSNRQYDVRWNRKTTQIGGWRTWNTNIQSCGCCVVAFVVIIWCFSPTSDTSLIIIIIIIEQMVCQNT